VPGLTAARKKLFIYNTPYNYTGDFMVLMEKLLTGDMKGGIPVWSKTNKIPSRLASELIHSLDDPADSPYYLEGLIRAFGKLPAAGKVELRKALVRVQMGCSINSHSDHVKANKQLFVSQVIEKMLFGFNFLSSEEDVMIDDVK
jgi:hypothetical protein